MHFILNYKINPVNDNTLVVGIDIAKRVHYACFVDERGRVMEKAFAVHQSKEGFESLYDDVGDMTIKKICAITKLSKSTLYRALDKRKNRGYL
jgi:hypothetical protein